MGRRSYRWVTAKGEMEKPERKSFLETVVLEFVFVFLKF